MSRSTARTAALTAVVTLVVLAAGALAFIYSGIYDVSATSGHTRLGRRVLNTIRERSIDVRVGRVPDPPPADSAMLAEGFEHYHAMCVECHGAPGIDRGEVGEGMTPEPPELDEEAEEMSTKELFWITRNGIKFGGMPAFGPTHSDQQIWGIVRFVELLPEMSPADYQGWVESYASADPEEEEGHTHPPGTPPHEH